MKQRSHRTQPPPHSPLLQCKTNPPAAPEGGRLGSFRQFSLHRMQPPPYYPLLQCETNPPAAPEGADLGPSGSSPSLHHGGGHSREVGVPQDTTTTPFPLEISVKPTHLQLQKRQTWVLQAVHQPLHGGQGPGGEVGVGQDVTGHDVVQLHAGSLVHLVQSLPLRHQVLGLRQAPLKLLGLRKHRTTNSDTVEHPF